MSITMILDRRSFMAAAVALAPLSAIAQTDDVSINLQNGSQSDHIKVIIKGLCGDDPCSVTIKPTIWIKENRLILEDVEHTFEYDFVMESWSLKIDGFDRDFTYTNPIPILINKGETLTIDDIQVAATE